LLGKEVYSTSPYAAHDDDLNSLFMQPTRKQSGLMFRSSNHGRASLIL
jgi:hypothetical protein